MVEDILSSLDGVLMRWAIGGSAAPIAPPAWTDALGSDAGEAELRLLALASQFLGALVIPDLAGPTRALADIPALSAPTFPAALRVLARRLLNVMRDARSRHDLLSFLAARGWALHPGDWMPAAGEEGIPPLYAPWRDWAVSVKSGGKARTTDADLTAETWDEFAPAARSAAFADLRRRDPAAARAVLEARVGGEAADARLGLIGALAQRLSANDREFLESLATDRAPKVKTLVQALLARLGDGPANAEEAAELAGFFEIQTSGLLRRARTIVARPLKTPAQHNRRQALFAAVDFAAFAGALALAPEEVAELWAWCGDPRADQGLAMMAAYIAPDHIVDTVCVALAAGEAVNPPALLALAPRLDMAQRRGAAIGVMRAEGGSCRLALTIGGAGARIDKVVEYAAGRALLETLDRQDETTRPPDVAPELLALGLIASRQAAREALERLTQAGLLLADSRLDMLRLNVALDDMGETT